MKQSCTALPSEAKSVSSKVIFITPEYARELLEANSANQRNINRDALEKNSRALRDGKWVLNGESIILSTTSRLLDGQHRIHACANTGTGFWTILVTGVPDEYFATIDQGRTRSLTDVMTINDDARHAHLPTTLVMLGNYLNKTLSNPRPMSNSECMDLKAMSPHLLDSVRWCHDNLKGIIAASRIAWLHYVAQEFAPGRCVTFFERLSDGVNLSADDPIYQLRARLIADRSTTKRMPRKECVAIVIKAWNAFYEGKRVKLLRFAAGEPFPRLNDSAPTSKKSAA